MATRLVQVNMKAQDDSALGGFWAAALSWRCSSEEPGVTNLEPEGFVYPDPGTPGAIGRSVRRCARRCRTGIIEIVVAML